MVDWHLTGSPVTNYLWFNNQKIMRKFKALLTLILVFASFSPFLKAQNTGIPDGNNPNLLKGDGLIQGILLDSITKKAVEFATIALIKKQTEATVDGTVTDEKGEFELKNIPDGEYFLEYGFLGYETKRSATLTITKGSKIKLGKIYLSPEALVLNTVTVEGTTEIIEEKVDRLVYNAEKDLSAKGGDASDVMRNVPLLTVDLDGNVSLRGSSNVRVLINNKPSSIMAGSVADALKQIPADMIKSIEVITSPSARYESEGSVGIINIITKKNTLQGMTLGIDLSAGNRGSMLGLNGNYRRGNMGFSLRGHGRAQYNVKGAFENTQTTLTSLGLQTSTQSAETITNRLHGNYNLGWDWDITKKSNLSAGLRLGTHSGLSQQDNLITRTLPPGSTLPILSGRNVDSKDLSFSYDLNLAFTHIVRPQEEFSFLGLFSRNNRTNDFEADLLNNVDFETITARQKNDNVSFNEEKTIQAEYQAPLGERQLIEFGGKGIFRLVNSDYQYFFSDGPNSPYYLDENRPSNVLNYDQTVGAGFLSYTLSTRNKFTFKIGSRLEFTDINARFQENNGETAAIPSYWSLIPSANVSKNISKTLTLKAGYNRRIQRPGIQILNPNVNLANITNISVGNPYLDPELTDNYEMSASINMKGVYLTAATFYRHTGNAITSLRDTTSVLNPNPDEPGYVSAIRTTYQNIGRENTIGFNVFGNVTMVKNWTINGGFDVYNVNLTNNNPDPAYNASNNGWVLGGRMFTNYKFKNGWGIQGGGGARGRQVNLQGYSGSFAFYNLGFRKEFKNGKGNLNIAAENFLNHPFKVNSSSKTALLTQYNTSSFYNAGIRIGVNYRIGKMTFEERRRKSINNDDIKNDGGGNDQGGMGAAGGEQPQNQSARGQNQAQNRNAANGPAAGQKPQTTPNEVKGTTTGTPQIVPGNTEKKEAPKEPVPLKKPENKNQ